MTGEEWPLPGIGVFQRTFWVGDQVVGMLASTDVPSPRGPRHWGQFSARVASAKIRIKAVATRIPHLPPLPWGEGWGAGELEETRTGNSSDGVAAHGKVPRQSPSPLPSADGRGGKRAFASKRDRERFIPPPSTSPGSPLES